MPVGLADHCVFGEVSSYFFNCLGVGKGKDMGAYLSFSGSGKEVGWEWAFIRGWALVNVFCLKDGRLFEVGANSNKYGILLCIGRRRFLSVYIHSLICNFYISLSDYFVLTGH